jgi:hypothetical protein
MLRLVNDSRYFDIVIRALHEALTELEVPHEVVTRVDPADDVHTYLVCTTHEYKPLPRHFIAYNFEQLTTDKKWDAVFFDRLKSAKHVWDYSTENIRVLAKHGIAAVHVPMGYAKCMELDVGPANRDRVYDFMFVGCMNEQRHKKLQPLMELNFKRLVSNACWGDDMREAYRLTKVGLNLHYYKGNTILEVHRIIPMIANRVWVASERSDDAWYDKRYEAMVTFFESKNDLVKKVTKVLKKPVHELQTQLEERYTRLVSEHSYVHYLKGSAALAQINSGNIV